MDNKYKIVIALIVAIIIFAFGRYSVKSETVIKTVEVQTHENKQIDKHTETTTTKAPDGTETTKTVTDITTNVTKDKSKEVEVQKTVEAAQKPKLNVSALMGYNTKDLRQLVVGAHISKDLLGPVSLGVWGTSDKSFGVSIGLSF